MSGWIVALLIFGGLSVATALGFMLGAAVTDSMDDEPTDSMDDEP